MISNFENLVEIFNKMNRDGFDTSMPLEWGFYFVDSDKEKLNAVFNELKDSNYILKDISQGDDSKWTLHASKIDILTVENLLKRNNAFNKLATFCNVELYDGWDVGKI